MLSKYTLALCALLLVLASPASAQVMMEHLLGKYATTDDGCKSDSKPEYEIRRGIFEGPNLHCILGAPKDASEGKEAYEAKCTEGDKVHLGTMTFDRSAIDKDGPMTVELPESTDWIALYLCK
jgi:hypothetical protein